MNSSRDQIWIAIDGPAGVGKTTVGKRLAEELSFHFINTGAMYRAVAWGLERGLRFERMRIELLPDGRVYLNDEDITEQLNDKRIDRLASRAAAESQVRERLIRLQRELAEERDVVIEGRDIGAVVLPDADVKLFLEASLEERVKRRYKERGGRDSLEKIREEIKERDERDSNSFGRLQVGEDTVVIDTEGLDVAAVVSQAIKVVEDSLKSKGKLERW